MPHIEKIKKNLERFDISICFMDLKNTIHKTMAKRFN